MGASLAYGLAFSGKCSIMTHNDVLCARLLQFAEQSTEDRMPRNAPKKERISASILQEQKQTLEIRSTCKMVWITWRGWPGR